MNRLWKWLWMLWLAGWPGMALPTHDVTTEHSVRAAMVFNLLKFTEGFRGEGRVLRLCVAGSDPAQMDALQKLEGRPLREYFLSVRRLSRNVDCDIIYVHSRQYWKDVIEYRGSQNVLTIGGYWGAVADGGAIEILFENGSPRFEISLREARRAGLRFHPQLLKLARQVYD